MPLFGYCSRFFGPFRWHTYYVYYVQSFCTRHPIENWQWTKKKKEAAPTTTAKKTTKYAI